MSADGLFASERRIVGPHYPVLAWHRAGRADLPLLVLAPGGGHLARIFYGHPRGEARNFLAHWLGALGYELLALSYPSDHPANRADCVTMTIPEWAADFAAAASQIATPDREVVLVGWSMAGRLARPFRMAAQAVGLRSDRFISLAATPQLPNLTSPRPGGEPLTPAGLWDSQTRGPQWRDAIGARRQAGGREPIDQQTYARDYRCDNPVLLRGEPREQGNLPYPLATLLDQLRPFDYADYPLCAALIPTRATDGRHALTDDVSWGYLNAQMLYCEAQRRLTGGLDAIADADWQLLRERVAEMPERLTRQIDGDHFFFVGEDGAQATAQHIHDLLGEMEPLRVWRANLPKYGKDEM